MARIETDPNYTAPTFSRATAGTDIFKKEDVQALAAAMSTHDHTSGKGLTLPAGSIPNGTITSAHIADGTIVAGDIADGAVTSAKILDGTIATADHADASVTNAKLGADTARANLLTNGGFEVWQRGNGPFTAQSAFTADRWQIVLNAGDALSVSRDVANKDLGSQFAAAVTYTRSSGGTFFRQVANELAPNLVGKTITLSVRVWCATANAVRLAIWEGTARTYGAYHTGGSTWQTLTHTVTVPFASTALFLEVGLDLSCTAYIDNAMLVVGSVAADYAPLHPADDLARCLRYYETIGSISAVLNAAQAYSTTQVYAALSWKVKKALTPTVTTSAAANYFVLNAAATPATCTAITPSTPSVDGFRCDMTVAAGLIAGNGSALGTLASGVPLIGEANP